MIRGLELLDIIIRLSIEIIIYIYRSSGLRARRARLELPDGGLRPLQSRRAPVGPAGAAQHAPVPAPNLTTTYRALASTAMALYKRPLGARRLYVLGLKRFLFFCFFLTGSLPMFSGVLQSCFLSRLNACLYSAVAVIKGALTIFKNTQVQIKSPNAQSAVDEIPHPPHNRKKSPT